jgi:oligopeptide/dipeptide ABC transporter ATP-binding protein
VTLPLLRVEGLEKHFPVRRGVFARETGRVRAVDGVAFDIAPGETLGLVGESGSGKTTVGRCVLRLLEPTAGRVLFAGRDMGTLGKAELRRTRRELQVIFQDPYSSLNPRLRVVDIVGEALRVHGLAEGPEVERRVAALLERVGLSARHLDRYPHEFSGGQRQRIGIARALALEPKLVVCDEAVSALDVSIQAQVLNLLVELGRERELSYLFIAHDLSVVRHVSHRVAVMYLGRIAELGPTKRLFEAPAHPYTRALLAAIPSPTVGPRPRRLLLAGEIPSPLNPPQGCRFHTRCPAVLPECRRDDPAGVEVEPGHVVHCVHAVRLPEGNAWFAELSRRIEAATAANTAAHEPAIVLTEPGQVPMREPRATASDRRMQRRPTLLQSIVALAVVLIVGHFVQEYRRRTTTEGVLRAVTAELEGRKHLSGQIPTSLAELGWRLYPIFPDGVPRDAWGRSLRYRVPGTDGRAFDLGSTGRDGVPSKDDIGHVTRVEPETLR